MKKICYGCKAFYIDPPNHECTLGFKHDVSTPMENCPKPKTHMAMIEIGRERDRRAALSLKDFRKERG